MKGMNDKYKNIIGMPHPGPRESAHRADRAAQFAPFAALTGYEGAVAETARLTDQRPEVAEDEAEKIDRGLREIRERLAEKPVAGIVYYVPDARKAGGCLVEKTASVADIDEDAGVIVFEDGVCVGLGEIVSVNS